jgi:hypothetical protein
MKKLLGGSTVVDVVGGEPPLGTCCWHTRDWTQHQCGLTQSNAYTAATAYHAMWCCKSCPPGVW